jgi:hypothetical protein
LDRERWGLGGVNRDAGTRAYEMAWYYWTWPFFTGYTSRGIEKV